jgi:GTPase SAR1 family protein
LNSYCEVQAYEIYRRPVPPLQIVFLSQAFRFPYRRHIDRIGATQIEAFCSREKSLMQLVEAKIAVVGDVGCGRTTLCHRMSNAAFVPHSGKAKHLDFYFAVGNVLTSESQGSEWCNLQPSVALKLVEPAGLDRSSLQSIIFRAVQGIIVLMDGSRLFKEKTEGYEIATCVTEMIQFWSSVALRASDFSLTFPGHSMPLVVVVSKCDLVPFSERAEFVEECRAAVAQSSIKADGVFFSVLPLPASPASCEAHETVMGFEPVEPQEICDVMASLVSKLPKSSDARTVLLNGPKKGGRACCS